MKKIFLFLLVTAVSFAQNANRKYLSHEWKNETLTIKVSDGTYRIKPYSDKIIETSFLPNGETFNPESEAVVLKPEAGKLKFQEVGKTLELVSPQIKMIVDEAPFKITYFNKNQQILSEKNGYTKKDSTEVIDFNLDTTENLYGGGSRVLGMNRRGNRLQLYNRAHYGYAERAELLNFCIPLVMSSKIYAVHFDNPAIGYLDLDSKKDNTLAYETISGRKTYQVIVGNNWEELVSNYTTLTGRQPLPARWTLGNFSSRFGYHNQEEVEKTVRRFEEDTIPVDAIILDLYWFGKSIQNTLGNFEWDKETFPKPEKMIADLNAKGIKTILITEPFVIKDTKKWQEAIDKKVLATDKSGNAAEFDFYFGHTGIIDVFKPEGKDWFWNIYKKFTNQGVGGWWGDLGEPEAFDSKAITAKGKADQVHNIYGHNWAKLVFEGYRKDFPKQRPFILMRSGYSGSQRYGIIPWSGDVSRSWKGLQSQPEISLLMGMQGIGYMHSDLGGFAGDYFDNELYLRWLQYGVFQPIFRPHAHEAVAAEPVYKDIVTKAKAKKLVELRYQMLPYNYTLAFENNQKGTPLMRPLFFEEADNAKLLNSSESYFWGREFLVTPIVKPGVTAMTQYFPKSANWFDFFGGKKYVGGTTSKIAVAEDHIPVFVRAGAFIPMIKTIQNTALYTLSQFDLHFYFDPKTAKSEGQLYNDDGNTPEAFENGAYEILHFTSMVSGKELSIQLQTETGKSFTSANKQVNLILHNIASKNIKVSVNGKNTAFKKSGNTLSIPVALGKNSAIKIQY
jgi:oligosaccharide 4-alpha-D-glucosyltransferase